MLAFVLASSLYAAPAIAPPTDGRRLLLDCHKQFLGLSSIRGTIKTRTTAWSLGEDTPVVDDAVSDFSYRRTEEIRFENAQPVAHTIIWNGKTLWIWSPTENAMVEEPAADVPPLTRTLLNVNPGFGLDALAAIPLDDYAVTLQPIADSTIPKDGAVDGDLVVTLAPKENADKRATLQIVVVPAKKLVRRVVSRVAERGPVISDVRYSDEEEVRPGVWFSRRVVTRELLPDGMNVESVKTFERLRYDKKIEDSMFRMTLPKDALRVRVKDVNVNGSARGTR